VPRMKEIFTMVGQQLGNYDLLPLVPAGLVISGGGADTLGITEVAKRTLNLPARVSRPVELVGLISDIQKPSYATSIGLLMYGKHHGGGSVAGPSFQLGSLLKNIDLSGVASKIGGLFKSLMP
jgi:cell division protein FtsA